MTDADLDPFAILDAIAPVVPRGKRQVVAGRICQGFMFFCAPDGSMTVVRRLAQAVAYVNARIDPRLHDFWSAHDPYGTTAMADRLPPDPMALLAEFEAQNDTHFGGTFQYRLWSGTRSGETPATRMMEVYHDRACERPNRASGTDASCFQLNIPLTWLAENGQPGVVQALFRALCDILRPRSAVAGLCLATPLAPVVLQDNEHLLKPLIDNHPGLIVGQAFDMHYRMRTAMSAPNWLTAVDGTLLEQCGGPEFVLSETTHAGVATTPMGADGLIFQAGPSPQLGNRDEGIALPAYGAVARALKPARLEVTDRMPHIKDYASKDAPYDEDLCIREQNAWLARFDGM